MVNDIIQNAIEAQRVDKSASPVSIQHSPPYITRQPLYVTNPTLFSAAQWRDIAKEPIAKLCIRHILRELTALEWKITHEDVDTHEFEIKHFTRVLNEADEGDGWDVWLSRMLSDALTLPIGGNSEFAVDDLTGMLGGLYHIDGATLYPTYDPSIPFVQVNPYNGLDRVYFGRGDLGRLIVHPRVELVKKMYQEAPVESAFLSIEALSRVYIYYLKQLGDTPLAGILDVMDMPESEAVEWAKGFREMFEGVDPLKIPLLYDHVKPARYIPFGRTPQEINVVEQFKRFAEMCTAAFGLSIGDLRLFEHERVLAGVQASQRVTARSGVGFYAQLVEDFVNTKILFAATSKLHFKFMLGMSGEEQEQANLAQTRSQILLAMTGNQPFLKPKDAQKQAEEWEIITVETTGVPTAPGLEGLGLPQDSLDSMDVDAETVGGLAGEASAPDALTTIDQAADELQQYKSYVREGSIVLKSREVTYKRFEALMTTAFRQIGEGVDNEAIARLVDEIAGFDKAVPAPTAAERLDALLMDADWYLLPDILNEVASILQAAYGEGALQAMEGLQRQGYAAGFVDSYGLPASAQQFSLRNPRVIQLLRDHGAELVQNVDIGTRHFLQRYLVGGVEKGLSPSDIATNIKNNLFGLAPKEAVKFSDSRVRSIVNTELNWADSRANFDQMTSVGLETKQWVTRRLGGDVCEICLANEALGPMPLDFEYATVFGDETSLHPPAHPMTCHCNLEANPDELKIFFEAGTRYWDGDELDDRLRQSMEDETARMIAENLAQKKHLPDQHDQQRHAGDGNANTITLTIDDQANKAISDMLKRAPSVKVEAKGRSRLILTGDKGTGEVWQGVGDRKWRVGYGVRDLNRLVEEVSSPSSGVELLLSIIDAKYAEKKWKDAKAVAGEGEEESDVEKSLPIQEWGMPDRLGKWSRFENEADAQRYLMQFSLAPVISDSDIDVIGAGYKYAGVIRGKDGDPFVEAALFDVDDAPVDEIKAGMAKFFGAKGIRTTNVVKSSAFEEFSQIVPGHYRKEFADFVRNRTSQEPGNVDDRFELELLYKDFMETLLVGGFDYWHGALGDDYPPLVRSVVKSAYGWQLGNDSPAMLRAYFSAQPDILGAATWLKTKGYFVAPLGQGKQFLSSVATTTKDDEMKNEDVLALIKSITDSQSAMFAAIVKSQMPPTQMVAAASVASPGGSPTFNIHLPESVRLNTDELVIKTEAPVVNVTVPEQRVPDVNISLPAMQPVINVEAAMPSVDVHVNPTPVEITNQVVQPDIKFEPKLNVNVPDMHVTVEQVEPKVVIVPVDAGKRKKVKIVRNTAGDVIGMEEDK